MFFEKHDNYKVNIMFCNDVQNIMNPIELSKESLMWESCMGAIVYSLYIL
jgi:hypothetical protein